MILEWRIQSRLIWFDPVLEKSGSCFSDRSDSVWTSEYKPKIPLKKLGGYNLKLPYFFIIIGGLGPNGQNENNITLPPPLPDYNSLYKPGMENLPTSHDPSRVWASWTWADRSHTRRQTYGSAAPEYGRLPWTQ